MTQTRTVHEVPEQGTGTVPGVVDSGAAALLPKLALVAVFRTESWPGPSLKAWNLYPLTLLQLTCALASACVALADDKTCDSELP